MKEKIKVLMAVDGSDQSLNAVRYIGGTFPAARTRVVLFHVRAGVPEAFLDLRRDAAFRSAVLSTSAWESQTRKELDAFMEKARDILSRSHFPADAVKVQIQGKQQGIARDILAESENGYDAAVFGRMGASKIKDFLLGSVVNKLVGKMSHLPIVVVGGDPVPKKALLGYDASEGAKRAVSSVADLMDPAGCVVTLCHITRHLNIHLGGEMVFSPLDERHWLDEATREMVPFIREAKNQLMAAGFAQDNIAIEILDEEVSRAARLVKNATAGGIGTIVLGRRGLSVVEEFLLGRVSTKTLQLAEKQAVWIC
jgi:nucleotide-binding universal stress UspA family protein